MSQVVGAKLALVDYENTQGGFLKRIAHVPKDFELDELRIRRQKICAAQYTWLKYAIVYLNKSPHTQCDLPFPDLTPINSTLSFLGDYIK